MFNPYTKAILGAMLILLGSLASAVEDGTRLTTSEIITAIVLAIGGLGAIWAAHLTVKWLVGGLVAFGSSIAVAMQDGTGVSTQEWLVAGVATLTALTAIYATSNTVASNSPSVT